ncbi:hypothetical protein K2173_027982 [Erythroxylum novogranatense]|uniref:Uncharacterized protein n=1 Tax=Erythroxylum novogranatense TaxID=1862640 RepID=A0AAV8U358_9ROSI|nr:hypothetical protein K2173_027982 [Erythroxylum novogranatense]
MAEVYKLSLSLALLIALVLTYGISSTEERPLNAALTHENENHVIMTTEMNTPEATSNLNVNHSRPTLETDSVHSTGNHADSESDDFRPTPPGHSPGGGHSTGPGSISSKEEMPLNAVLTHENENHVMTTKMNTPEATSNLNVNHSSSTLETDSVHSTRNHADFESDGFRPTGNGPAPGVGHSIGPGGIPSH